jgi:hypothetical protein
MNFRAQVDVTRLTKEAGGPVTGYTAEVTIRCDQCEMPFRFIGLEAGNHHAEPRVSVDGAELRAPIEPAEHQVFAPRASYTMPPRAQH